VILKLLSDLASLRQPPIDVNKLPIEEIEQYMIEQYNSIRDASSSASDSGFGVTWTENNLLKIWQHASYLVLESHVISLPSFMSLIGCQSMNALRKF